ncbi:NAD-dependent epimerase/dehydratase family protein [Nocardioides sp.]|uniref:NAD-dependent epimerase/dehydratase family protein n=1 Tax=Nocardioides sp. TaxID=35761 RepID=UPI0037849CF3
MVQVSGSESGTYLVTGSAGFIGFHVAKALLDAGHQVAGVDALTDYYDVTLKNARLARLQTRPNYTHRSIWLEDRLALRDAFDAARPDVIIHLAAQAGVRHSLENPRAYLQSNIVGTFNVLEEARARPPRHLLIASTSSVYGSNNQTPYRERERTDHPLSFYAATKKAVEDCAHSYSHLHSIPITCFRFFTVYGPWGRPDMALYKFVQAAFSGQAVQLHDPTIMRRDFTYIDDLVNAIQLLVAAIPRKGSPVSPDDSLSPSAPYRTVNIGAGQPVSLLDFVSAIERATGKELLRQSVPAVPGELPETYADTTLLQQLTGFSPTIGVDEGVANFVDWYRKYYS